MQRISNSRLRTDQRSQTSDVEGGENFHNVRAHVTVASIANAHRCEPSRALRTRWSKSQSRAGTLLLLPVLKVADTSCASLPAALPTAPAGIPAGSKPEEGDSTQRRKQTSREH